MVKHIIPDTLSEALKYLYQGDFQVFAGGTDLMVQNRSWSETSIEFTKNMLYCFNLQELKGITAIDGRIEIGAMTPLETIMNHPDVPSLLSEAIGEMASPAIRHIATLAGNIGNASPAGDSLPVLILYDAWVELRNMAGFRMILLKDLIIGPRKTVMHPEEMIVKIVIPKHRFDFERFVKVGGRKADAISKVSFAGAVDIEDGKIADLRLTFGAVGKTVVRNETVEGAWIGMTISELKNGIWRLIDMYDPLILPIDDQRSNKHYRKTVAINLLRDFVDQL
ncbi:MAG: FAD binding domain-containing protein [Candidatus Izemoplasmatales bacterium]|jgi:CO/xanthine dehydrogenase FAD-binding subunit|nr:FAD binding domain-containing protein [Candidatus Izemoplasmatales bacterium]MDD3865149.1 FAD binding domain-containing protein [Candidatus Izemoplasmatales bacterium]